MDLLAAAFLGIVQGLTEFLPVSSSGHLILARAFFGWDPGRFGLPFDVACHVGTFVAVVVFFLRDVLAMMAALPGALTGRRGEYEQLVRLVIAGTIPVVIVGLFFADALQGIRSPVVVAVTLAAGGLGLILAERLGAQARGEDSIGTAKRSRSESRRRRRSCRAFRDRARRSRWRCSWGSNARARRDLSSS